MSMIYIYIYLFIYIEREIFIYIYIHSQNSSFIAVVLMNSNGFPSILLLYLPSIIQIIHGSCSCIHTSKIDSYIVVPQLRPLFHGRLLPYRTFVVVEWFASILVGVLPRSQSMTSQNPCYIYIYLYNVTFHSISWMPASDRGSNRK